MPIQEEPYATRREFDMLVSRVESIDVAGPRGIGGLQASLAGVISDVAELKVEMNRFKDDTGQWFKDHAKAHETEQKERVVGRRWLIGIAIAGLAAMATVIALLLQVVQTIK